MAIHVVWLLQALFFLGAFGHIQLENPLPIRSPLDPANSDPVRDYDYVAPLLYNGSNYPCKGYHLDARFNKTTATYTAGGSYSIKLAGSTTHGGGSCQISLSYDNGATFTVIKSIIGGCPMSASYSFNIPSSAPSSNTALLAWSWFNLQGKPEMYMNCARVAILGSFQSPRLSRQSNLNSFPSLFPCNVGKQGKYCRTVEGQDVHFPDPGSSDRVEFGIDGFTPHPGIGYEFRNAATYGPGPS